MIASDLTLTPEQKSANFETMRHMERVRNLLNDVVIEFLHRGRLHDQSKLAPPEVEAMAKNTDKLNGLTYGKKDYADNLEKEDLKAALAHHYANNRHHPQHFKNGVNGMNLIDLLEMLCDWKAASERHNNGNIRTSLAENIARYDIEQQLAKIIENTAEFLFR